MSMGGKEARRFLKTRAARLEAWYQRHAPECYPFTRAQLIVDQTLYGGPEVPDPVERVTEEELTSIMAPSRRADRTNPSLVHLAALAASMSLGHPMGFDAVIAEMKAARRLRVVP